MRLSTMTFTSDNFVSSMIIIMLLLYLAPNLCANTADDVLSTTIVVNASRSARLDCRRRSSAAGVGSSSSLWLWFFNGDPIDASNNSRYKMVIEPDHGSSSLTIENTVGSDSGLYSCVIIRRDEPDSNGGSNDTTVIKLIVRDVPSPVHEVTVQCDNDSTSVSSATIKFQYVESCPDEPAKEFLLQYSNTMIDGDQDQNEEDRNPNYSWHTHVVATSHLKNDTGMIRMNLYPYGNFAFRVLARNEIGLSAPTRGDQFCRTPANRPNRNPSNVRVKGETSEDVTIFWEPLRRHEWNGPEFQYVVRYKSCGDENSEYKESILSNPLQDHLVLPAPAAYQCFEASVGARNSLGYADVQPALYRGFSGEEKPNKAPTGFQFFLPPVDKPTMSTFVWDRYITSEFKGVLRGFKIQHWHKNKEHDIQEEYFSPSSTRGIVYNLKPHAMNYARILAYSGGGDGPVSEILLVNTPEGFSGPVRDLEAFALSQSEVGIMWKKPLEVNGIVSGYNVTSCQVVDPSNNDRASNRIDLTTCNSALLNSSYRYHRLVNLTANTTYLVQVTCLTGAGEGTSNSIDIRTLHSLASQSQAYPEQPGLRVTGIGAQRINATWIPGRFNPRDPKPIGNTFYMQYRKKGAQFWTSTVESDGDFTTHITTGLQPSTEYEIRAISVAKGDFGKNVTRLETSSGVLAVNTTKEGAERLQAIVHLNNRSNMIKARSHVLGG